MKILSVSLYNIASIEGPFTLNLEAEPLKSVGLFAITGATNGYAKVVFQAADTKHYQAEWHVSRARGKQQGNLQQEHISISVSVGISKMKSISSILDK